MMKEYSIHRKINQTVFSCINIGKLSTCRYHKILGQIKTQSNLYLHLCPKNFR